MKKRYVKMKILSSKPETVFILESKMFKIFTSAFPNYKFPSLSERAISTRRYFRTAPKKKLERHKKNRLRAVKKYKITPERREQDRRIGREAWAVGALKKWIFTDKWYAHMDNIRKTASTPKRNAGRPVKVVDRVNDYCGVLLMEDYQKIVGLNA